MNPSCAIVPQADGPDRICTGTLRCRWTLSDQDEGAPIDPSGELPSGERFSGFEGLREIMLQKKRNSFCSALPKRC